MVPVIKLIPGMSHTPETAARRYLQASEFGTDVRSEVVVHGSSLILK